jgi:hypothetical protein
VETFSKHYRDPDRIAERDEDIDAKWLPEMLPIMEIPLKSLCQYQRSFLRRGWGQIEISVSGKAKAEEFGNFWVTPRVIYTYCDNENLRQLLYWRNLCRPELIQICTYGRMYVWYIYVLMYVYVCMYISMYECKYLWMKCYIQVLLNCYIQVLYIK